MRIRTLLAATLLGSTLIVSLGVSSAKAQSDAKVRVAHFSPDAEAVDVYIDGKKKMNSVPYLAMSEYVSLPAGQHTFEIRGAGAPPTSPAVLSASETIAAGSFTTVAAIGPVARIKAGVFNDKLSTPGSGKSKVRVIHAADGTSDVDVSLKTGTLAFPKVTFGTVTEYAEIQAGSYDLQILGAGTQEVVLAKNVTLQAGGVYTIAAIGGAGKPPTLRGFVDLTPGAAVATTVASAPAATVTSAAPATTKPPATTSAAPPTTSASSATSAKPPVTTVPPTATKTTIAAASQTTIAAAVTETTVAESVETTPDTEAAVETTVAEAAVEGTDAAPATPTGGVSTGFGGLSDSQSSAALILLGLVAAGAVITGRSRRRSLR